MNENDVSIKKVRCKNCIRAEARTDVYLDQSGMCEKCLSYFNATLVNEVLLDFCKFSQALRQRYTTNPSRYDCLALYSGGKDSTYMLYQLSRVSDFRILAVTIDFWFISPETRKNMVRVLKKLSIDHLSFSPAWSIAKQLYQKTIPITGKLCSVCEALLTSQAYSLALEMRIPSIAWGLPKQQFRTPPPWMFIIDRDYWEKVRNKFIGRVGEIIGADSKEFKKFEEMYVPKIDSSNASLLPDLIFPFLAIGYDVNEVEKVCQQVDWKRPSDVFGASSNCFATHLHAYLSHRTNSVAYLEDYLSDFVRKGFISRDRAINAIDEIPDLKVVNEILAEVGVNICATELADEFLQSGKSVPII